MEYNMCNLFRTFFMLIVVDFSFEVLIKISSNIASHMDVFFFFIGECSELLLGSLVSRIC